MGLAHDEAKWKKKGPSNRRIGVSSIEQTPTPKIENIDSQLGNKSLTGGHAKSPKQGRRM